MPSDRDVRDRLCDAEGKGCIPCRRTDTVRFPLQPGPVLGVHPVLKDKR